MRRNRSFKWFLISSIAFAVAIPVVVIGSFTLKLSTDRLKNEIVRRNNLIAAVLVAQTEAYLNKPLEDLRSFKQLIDENNLGRDTINSLIDSINNTHEYFTKLQVVDNSGIVLLVSPHDEEFIGIDMSKRLFFTETKRTGKNYWSPTFISPQLNIPVATLSLPLKEGVITGYLSLSHIRTIVEKISATEKSIITITDQSGTFVVHFDENKVYERAIDPSYDKFRKAFTGTIINKTVIHDGKEMIVNVDFIRQTDWAVAIYHSAYEVFAPVKRLYLILAAGILIPLILTVLLSFRHINIIVGILKEFIETTRVISSGNYDVAIKEPRYREFGELTKHFNKMTRSIKKREETIIESEKKLKEAQSLAQLGYWELSTHNQATYLSDEVFNILGRTPENLKANYEALISCVHPEDKERVTTSFRNLFEHNLPLNIEHRIQKPNGEIRYVQQQIENITDAHGNPTKSIGTIQDISGRIESEKALRESEERFRIVLEANPDPVVLYDMEGRVLFFNPAFTEVFGWSLEKSLGQPLDFVPQKKQAEANALLQKVMAGVSLSGIETLRNTNAGETIPVSISAAIFYDQNDKPAGTVVNLHNISAQKQLEIQLQQSQKMESIGTLAGGIAHDFNNILSAVIGYSEISLEDVSPKTLLYSNIEQVLKAGQRAKELVKQILTFSRQSEKELRPLQVKLITKEALKLLRASFPSTIDIKQNLGSTANVLADPTQIHQVLMNICTNAAQAMQEKGGKLGVCLEDVELDLSFAAKHPGLEPGPFLKLSISDTGHGMTPALQERIFDPFFTTKEKEEGTGMGLSVVHGIVKSHGGTITTHSEPGQGATFSVYLPRIESQRDLEFQVKKPIPTGSERILLIDDEQSVVDMCMQILCSIGYEVTSSTKSTEALDLFRSGPHRFDLIITDMTMPQMTGDILAKQCMRIRPSIPIIICTGFSTKMDEKKAMAMGIRAFVTKPVLKQDIAETIRKVLDNH